MKTFLPKIDTQKRAWRIVDADGLVLGRVAAKIADALRGRDKPTYTPHLDAGDFVVVINAEKVRVTGKKETDKEYFRHTGYPGGGRVRTPKEVRVSKPTFMVQNAVKGMLPKGVLGREMFRKLKVYAGSEHPHGAQQPEALEL